MTRSVGRGRVGCLAALIALLSVTLAAATASAASPGAGALAGPSALFPVLPQGGAHLPGAHLPVPPRGGAGAKRDTRIPGNYIVVFKDSVEHPRSVARTQAKSRGGKLGFVYPVLNGYSAKSLSKGDVEALRNDPRVKYVSPDRKVEAFSQTTPTGIDRTFATANEGLAIDEADNFRVDVDVAVIDTGIDYEHPDLNVVARTNCVLQGIEECEDGGGRDGRGHGTHVAGTIGAADNGVGVVGVAPGARLWAVKVLNDSGSGAFSWVIAGVEWVTAHADQIEVANMSLGGPNYPPLDEAIAASAEAGVVYAVAAGNSNADAKNFSPANSLDVITVSALADYDGKAGGEAEPLKKGTCDEPSEENYGSDDTSASFSNYGKDVEVAAPGVCILSTYKEGKYAYLSGTSMASPHVAGAAALLASKENPEDLEDVEAIRQTIEEEGNQAWEDTSKDGVQEPLLDVGDETVFAPADQIVVTGKTDILSTSEATLHGSLNPGGLATNYYFEYGTTTGYGAKAPASGASAGSGGEYVSVEETIKGLKGQTPYHYRLVASSEAGTFHGNDRVFGTTPPTVSTQPATEVDANDAELNADVNPEGFATTYKFEYGPTTSYGVETSPSYLEAGSEAVEVPPELTDGFDGEATYHFRVSATNMVGTTYGEDETFTTQPADWVTQATPKPHPEAEEEEGVIDVGRALEGVSCPSIDHCVAIGGTRIHYEDSSTVRDQEAWDWDGETWSSTELPMPEGIDTNRVEIRGISCPSSSSCFAVAAENSGQAFIEHWDGKQWSVQLLPPEENEAREIIGISCGSPNSCMAAVQNVQNAVNIELYVWDGEEWSRIARPTVPFVEAAILKAPPSCPSADECMLAGTEWSATWDGESWEVEEIPRPPELPENEWVLFSGVSCVSLDACMAVGRTVNSEYLFGPARVMSAYWDGQKWTFENMPEPISYAFVGLYTDPVSCTTASDCVLVTAVLKNGYWEDEDAYWQMLAEHWDGEQWSIQSGVSPLWPRTRPHGVSCVQSRCTVVGSIFALPFGVPGWDGDGMFVARLRSSPVATTKPATNVRAKAATLNARVNPEGYETTYQFEYTDQADFEKDGYKNAISVPTSPKGIGSGTSSIAVSRAVSGLEPSSKYHFRVKATNSAGTTYGEDETLTTTESGRSPALDPPGGSFPASFSLAGEQKVSLRGPAPVNCTTKSGVLALGGEGQFDDATSGTATLTLHNCKESSLNSNCTTSGQAAGTIKTEALPFRLTYLSDGEPGVLFLPNAESGAIATAKCVSDYMTIKVLGSGVLGHITDPALGEASPTLTVDLNAPESGGGKYVQEYVKTEAGAEYGLQETVNGGKAEAAALEAETVASFDKGEATLAEEARPALDPPGGSFPASFSLAGEQKVSLRGPTGINCTTKSGVLALGGEGQFDDATSGTATLTLHNCKESSLNSNCTTSGQAAGTIKTEALPFRLTYLSDGEPGVLFLPNAKSGLLATTKCLGGFVTIKVLGSGVLGHITDPALGEASPTLTVDLNAPESGGGKYVQEYVKTEAGAEYGLQETVNGGKAEAAALEAEAVASFSGGEGELTQK